MKEFLYTISMAQPVVMAWESAETRNIFMVFFWLFVVIVLHIMANEEALRR